MISETRDGLFIRTVSIQVVVLRVHTKTRDSRVVLIQRSPRARKGVQRPNTRPIGQKSRYKLNWLLLLCGRED